MISRGKGRDEYTKSGEDETECGKEEDKWSQVWGRQTDGGNGRTNVALQANRPLNRHSRSGTQHNAHEDDCISFF